jgi:hypothetical protein
VGMEATGYSRWFGRLLAELGFEVWIGNFWSRLAIANVHSGHDAQLAASHSCCHSAAEMKYFGEDFYWSTHGPVFSMKRHP